MFEPFKPFTASEFQIKFATESWERAGATRLRRQVFCEEQALFTESDRDEKDASAHHIVAVSLLGIAADEVVGTVRIHEAEPGVWWGSRLAVTPRYRKVGTLGSALIRLAVASANAFGCRRFLANVQSQNALLFRRLHWRPISQFELYGVSHQQMEADLQFYPPFLTPESGFIALRKVA